MTKQEAIQDQIDNIMDTFEFDRVQTVNVLKGDYRTSGSGGFTATKEYGEDDGKPWVRISLFFGLEESGDGVSYDK